MIVLCFSMQGYYIFERTNDNTLVCKRKLFLDILMYTYYILVSKRKLFLDILMASVIYVHFSQLVNHCVT